MPTQAPLSPRLGLLSALFSADYSDPVQNTVSMESTEGVVDGKSFEEIEFQIYGKLTDMSVLQTAQSVTKQEQWSHKIVKTDNNAGSAVIRVRSINSGERYIRTSKVKSISGATNEVESESTYDEFVHMAILADQGMIKERYTFPTEGYVYEVDVFFDKSGNRVPWVKIDLEIQAPEGTQSLSRAELLELVKTIDLPPLPFALEDVVVLPPVGRQAADERKVSKLYEQYFLIGNYFQTPPEDRTVASELNVDEIARNNDIQTT